MDQIIICGNQNQANTIRSRIKAENVSIEIVDLTESSPAEHNGTENALYIAADNAQEQKLLALFVREDQIINYSRFENTTFDNPLEKFEPQRDYTALLLGMSHSQCAIDTEKLPSHSYCKLSSPSMDLFCHFQIVKNLAETYPEKLRNIQQVIVELPYYIFNFDLSRFGSFVHTKLNYFESFGDYHHFGEKEEQKRRIEEFRRFRTIFERKAEKAKSSAKRPFAKRIAKSLFQQYRIARNRDKVWNTVYENTVRENEMLWKQLLELLKQHCPEAEITVLVMPFHPIFRLFHQKEISRMKALFLQSLENENIRILDHFNCLKSPHYFDDHCHLNAKGAEKYIKILSKECAD